MPQMFRMRGKLDVAALERALNKIVERHESLRTTFALRSSEPVQVIAPTLQMALPMTVLSEVPEPQRENPNAVPALLTNEPAVTTKVQDSSPVSPQNLAPAPNAALKPEVTSPPSAQSDSHQAAASPSLADSARNSESETQKQSPAVRPSSSVPVVAIAPKLFFDRTTILLLAILAAAAVLVLAWIWLRRSRSTRHVSLITRSLDHEKP